MRYYFHILHGSNIECDNIGESFPSIEAARHYGLDAIRNYFLVMDEPRLRLVAISVLCIIDGKGNFQSVPFIEAFRTRDEDPILHCAPGHA